MKTKDLAKESGKGLPLQSEVRRFCEARDWDQFHDLKDLSIGLVTESAELLDLFRFRSKEECEAMLSDIARREKIEDEISDVYFFLLRIIDRYEIDIEKALQRKLAKNEAKYPVEKSRGRNLKYDEFE